MAGIFTAIGLAVGATTAAAGTGMLVVAGTAAAAGVANSLLNKPKQPAAPDYAAAATAQGQANIDAAMMSARLSNPNIISPYGTQTVTYGGTPTFNQAGYDEALAAYNNQPGDTSYQGSGYDEYGNYVGTGNNIPMPTREQFTTQTGDPNQPTVTQTLTPAAQAALENQQRVQQGLSAVGLNALEGVRAGMTTTDAAGNVVNKPFVSNVPDFQTSLGDQGPINYGPSAGQYGLAGSINADRYGLAGSVNADKYGLAQGFDAGRYGNARGELDLSNVARMPVNAGMTAQQSIMARLGPQIQAGREATAQTLANQGITQGSVAYNNAMRAQSAGETDLLNEAARSGIALDMAANQQGYGQQLSSAGLYNSALGQNFSQGLQANQASNQAIAQNYGQGVTSQQLGNQAIGQNFGQGITAQNQANAAIGQNYGQGLQSAGFYNQAQNQKYNQDLQSAQFGNTALGQQYQRNLGEYNLPLNTLTALQSGSQIQNPQFQAYAGQTIAPAPIANATTLAGNFAQNQYGQNVAANNATTQGLFGIAGAGFGAGMGGGGLFGAPTKAIG